MSSVPVPDLNGFDGFDPLRLDPPDPHSFCPDPTDPAPEICPASPDDTVPGYAPETQDAEPHVDPEWGDTEQYPEPDYYEMPAP
jgi:hypothetical protein